MHRSSALRPADNLGFVKNALNANPKPEIDFVIVREQLVACSLKTFCALSAVRLRPIARAHGPSVRRCAAPLARP